MANLLIVYSQRLQWDCGMTQTTKTCPDCGNEEPNYKCSDRHRGYYECGYGTEITVDYYA